MVSYGVKAEATLTLTSGAQEGYVKLLSDASNPPTTERERVGVKLDGSLSLGISQTSGHRSPLRWLVPAGHYVQLVAVTVSGTPTIALDGPQHEQVLA